MDKWWQSSLSLSLVAELKGVSSISCRRISFKTFASCHSVRRDLNSEMCSKCVISVLLSWQLSAIVAQQACYYPNRFAFVNSPLINCYSSQTSVCCEKGDACMSNGLCVSGAVGIVCIMYSLSYAPNSDLEYLMGQKLI